MKEKVPLLTFKPPKSLRVHLSSPNLMGKPTSTESSSCKITPLTQVKPIPPLKRFRRKYKYVITAVFTLLGFKLFPPVAFTRAQTEFNRPIFGIGGGTDAIKKNSIIYNSPGSLNENGQGLFDITSTFNQGQREVGISESLAKELSQNVHQAAKDLIDTNLNSFYKLDKAAGTGGGIGAAAALKDYVEFPQNSPPSTTPKSAIKVAKNPSFYGAFVDITARALHGMSKVTKDVYGTASKEGSRGGKAVKKTNAKMGKLIKTSVTALVGCVFTSILGKFGLCNLLLLILFPLAVATPSSFPPALIRSSLNPPNLLASQFDIITENLYYPFLISFSVGLIYVIRYFPSPFNLFLPEL